LAAYLRIAARSAGETLSETGAYAARLLYDRIFEMTPLRAYREAGKSHLCVVPYGPYHFVPLGLLAGEGPPLADEWAVTVLPNLSLLDDRRPSSKHLADLSPMTAVGLGFAGRTDVRPIPEALEEAGEIAAVYGTTPVLDQDATKSAVLEALQSSRRVHLATHGEDNPPAPSLQPLLLAGGERLLAHEVARLDLSHLELVTLGACESGLGRFDEGDNMSGLVASLFLAGVKTVVATLWPCRSKVSQLFFATFHRHLASGVIAAYSAALRTTRDAYPEPCDWACFNLLGSWS
jgi:CHAT domain-containing protein